MRPISTIALIAGLTLAGAGAVSAQNATPTRQVPDSLVAKAKVNEDSAQKIALKRVPGTVESVKLYEKNGKLDWLFGIKPTGKTHEERVTISASTGKVVSVSSSSSKKKPATQR